MISELAERPGIRVIYQVRRAFKRPQLWFALLWLSPWFAFYATFEWGPILRAFWMAVIDYKLLRPEESEFTGLKHFRMLFNYSLFWTALSQTLTYALTFYLISLPLALLVSALIVGVSRGRNFYQFVVFLPVVVSLVAVSLLFRMLMDSQIGAFNQILRSLGLPTSRFLTHHESALWSVIGVDIWKSLGFWVVILSAAMLNIPPEMYDAAKVDGASAWQRFWRVTLPLLGHTLMLISVLMVMHGLQVYTQVEVMTDGGPGTSTYVLNLLIYREAFENWRLSFATATAFSQFVMILAITVIQLKVLRPAWSY